MSYEAQVADVLGALVARPPGAYLWFGRRFEAPELAAAIRERLLADFYATGAPRAPRHGAPPAPGDDGGEFARALSQANCGRGAWQAGWRVAGHDEDGIAIVRPDGLRLLAPAEDVRADGERAQVRIPKELRAHSPGSYIALGDAPGPQSPLVRLSWNIAAAGAPTLVARLTYVLNGAGLPFRLEVGDDPARYPRRDGAALLLAREDFAAATKLLRPLLRALGQYLADGAPALTKPLARGLAVAEEPAGDATSFGDHRCALIAEAVLAGGETVDDVGERFAAAGLSLDVPFLDPGSEDVYAFA